MRKTMGVMVAMVLAATSLDAAAAAPKGSNEAEKAGTASDNSRAVHQLYLADAVADYGHEARNPMALIVAAEMIAQAGAREVEQAKTSDGKGTAGDKAAKPERTVASLLGEARALAGQNAALLAAIDRVGASESKGRSNGPGEVSERVLAGDTDTYTIRFNGGEEAAVLVVGDGDTDLDLYVYDENGNLVCDDADSTDTMLCEWTPRWTGDFTVKVKNLGSVYNAYDMVTN
ncbi:hypothetical protein [Pseudoxanthomonas sp. 10H]|uniref:hypothetical protein n=1 Tax=Pseudoxanthomonas sp. 10H TaxID=3242729 RepID=UPI003556417F